MKEMTFALLAFSLILNLPVNAWPQQSPASDLHATTAQPQAKAPKPTFPKISVSPASANFGNYVGTTLTKTIIVKNSGKADLQISSINITGINASDFSKSGACSTIPAGGSCNLTVTFAPGALGKRNAIMIIASNDSKKPLATVKLSGNAKAIACFYNILTSSGQFEASGGTGSVNVTSGSGCTWTAASNDPGWITITSGSSGSGNGTVAYSVSTNPGNLRTGTIRITAQTFTQAFTITQSQAQDPAYPLSEYQEELLYSYSDPDYINIAFSSEPPYRQETWVYKDLAKIYLFWDGESLGATELTTDPEAYSDPPYLDPALFTKDITLPELAEILGSTYKSIDHSAFRDQMGNTDFQTYEFSDLGLYVSFLNGSLAAVQTIDFPKNNAASSIEKTGLRRRYKDGRVTQASKNSHPETNGWAIGTPLPLYEEESPGYTLLIATILITLSSCGKEGYDTSPTGPNGPFLNDVVGSCVRREGVLCFLGVGALIADCSEFLKSKNEKIPGGIGSAGQSAQNVMGAKNKCGSNQQNDNQPPHCPGTATPCATYSYSDWSPAVCGPEGKQTRTATPLSPPGCVMNVGLPLPETTRSCTPVVACTDYSYSEWSACGTDGTQTRTVMGHTPAGCTGNPSNPPVLSQSCSQPCTGFTYSDWGVCEHDGVQSRSVEGYTPAGCAGSPPNPPVTTQSCTPNPQCTGYSYSDWSACGPDGTQTRGTIGLLPAGCTGNPPNPPVTTQPCPCTSYTSTTSSCENIPWQGIVGLGTITTTFTGVPAGCVGGVFVPAPSTRCCVLDPC